MMYVPMTKAEAHALNQMLKKKPNQVALQSRIYAAMNQYKKVSK